MASLEMKSSVSSQQEIIPPVTKFPPNLWGDLFSSCRIDTQESESYAKEIEELKEKIRNVIVDDETKLKEKLVLIDTLERLGLSYHFENEIQAHLELSFNGHFKLENEEKDLFITALEFRLLRQHGFDASSCVFKRFTKSNGKFKEKLRSDIKGLLSLYEAAHLRYHGETILDEALIFSTVNLESIVHEQELSNTIIIRQAKHALDQPLQKAMERFEARYFIDLYEKDELKDESLLRLAKLDFNLLQMLHKKEVCEVSRWWKDLDLTSTLSYARNRIVECYVWSLGFYFEPQYSRGRVMLTKTIVLASVLDDTYDSYGTIDELESFTHAIERWDIKEMDKLPDYMKIFYKAFLDLYDQYEEELRQHGRSFAAYYAKAKLKELARGYNTEAKWFIKGHTPPFADYLANGCITSTYYAFTPAMYMGMNSATREAFEWAMYEHKIKVASASIGRIMNDTASYKFEKKRGQPATGFECYMKEHGVSEEKALEELINIVENAWKDINEEFVKENGVSKEMLKRIVNMARMTYFFYKHNHDKYTNPEEVLKPQIFGLLVDSFEI